jgi:hypothetical protein
MGELNNITGNFGQRALIGEGSYGQIYRATLTSGELGPSESDFRPNMTIVVKALTPLVKSAAAEGPGGT